MDPRTLPHQDLPAPVIRAMDRIRRLLLDKQACIISVSYGKDSSSLLNLTLQTAVALKKAGHTPPPIVVTHADTLIENPEIAELATTETVKIGAFAREHGLDVSVHVSRPGLWNHWASRVIGGRMLPSFPDNNRDCTIDFKINPMKRLRHKILSAYEAQTGLPPVTLIGTRFGESDSRDRRMRERDDAADGVRQNKDGEWVATPIADWSADDVWEYLGACRDNTIGPSYSDFNDTFRIYADAGATSCAVVADMMTTGQPRGGGCGSRHGCLLCTVISKDKSLANMIITDSDRYGYLDGWARFRDYLMNTQYDLDKRTWVGRSINEHGFISLHADVYSPAMLGDLLRYALSLDADERNASERAGLDAPRFQLIGPRELVTIDATWSLLGYQDTFEALRIYRDVVVRGNRYAVPDVYKSPKIAIPDPRYIYVGANWDQGRDWLHTGLQDVTAEAFGGAGCVRLENMTARDFDVDEEGASMLLGFELDYLCDNPGLQNPVTRRTEAYRTYLRYGTMQISNRMKHEHDKILRRTAFRERHGIAGDISIDTLLERSLSESDMLDRVGVKKRGSQRSLSL